MSLVAQLDRAIRAAGIPVESVSIGRKHDKGTWRVQPTALQADAQPIIDAFNPEDPAHLDADLDATVKATLDQDRLISAVVWAMVDSFNGPASKAKYTAARTKIIAAYKAQPWRS